MRWRESVHEAVMRFPPDVVVFFVVLVAAIVSWFI